MFSRASWRDPAILLGVFAGLFAFASFASLSSFKLPALVVGLTMSLLFGSFTALVAASIRFLYRKLTRP